jgi:hypothetical protein
MYKAALNGQITEIILRKALNNYYADNDSALKRPAFMLWHVPRLASHGRIKWLCCQCNCIQACVYTF